MKIFQITSSEELKIALDRANEIWETDDAEELKELDVLATLICDFEEKSFVESNETNESEFIDALTSIPSVGDDSDFKRVSSDKE